MADHHISVCVCTYKRPELLKRLLEQLAKQETGGVFSFSIVAVDNDRQRSAETVVSEVADSTMVRVRYVVEPRQGIARARNKAVANADGDYLAFIDDDEFLSSSTWLLAVQYSTEVQCRWSLRPSETALPGWHASVGRGR